mgnify:CR=1 FL=1
MKKKIKKAFTLVELLVVIAILAILATVSIVGYNSFTKKARVSNDTVLVKQMNDILYANKQTDDVNPTMSKALEDVFDGGYDLTKLTPTTTNYNIMWDRANDQMVLADENLSFVYPEASKVSERHEDLFVVVKNAEELSKRTNAGYSVYLHDDYNETTISDLKAGIDTGKVTTLKNITINTTNKEFLLVNTGTGNLTVNAEGSHVEHYGLANEVSVNKVSENTYVEHGVVGKMTVAADAKNVVVKKNAVVGEIANSSENLNIENGYVVKVTGNAPKTGKEATSGAEINVSTYEQLQGLALSSTVGANIGIVTIKLQNDINLTGKTWQPFGYGKGYAFSGTIDGNNHKIIGLSNGNYVGEEIVSPTGKITGRVYGFIAFAENCIVKNINFENVDINYPDGTYIGTVIGHSNNEIQLSNVMVSGNIFAKDKVGGLVGYTGNNATIDNCTNKANVTAYNESSYCRAGGLVGACTASVGNKIFTLTIKNSSNTGTVIASGLASDCSPSCWNNAVKVSSLFQNARMYAGQFVGQLNSSAIVSENNNGSGIAKVENSKKDGKYGLSMFVNKCGKENGTWKPNDDINGKLEDFAYTENPQ